MKNEKNYWNYSINPKHSFLGCTSVKGTGGNSVNGNGGDGVSGPTTGSTNSPHVPIDLTFPIK